jgi:hypothetical protein
LGITHSIYPLLKLGKWSGILYPLTAFATRQIEKYREMIPPFFTEATNNYEKQVYLLVTSTPPTIDPIYPDTLPEGEQPAWEEFWQVLNAAYEQFLLSSSLNIQVTDSLASRFAFSWPEFKTTPFSTNATDRIHPGRFSCLAIEESDEGVNTALLIYSIFLATRWHAMNDELSLHACAVARRGQGFLFLGPSTAGKTTVANLSKAVGHTVLGDDLNFVLHDVNNLYRLAAGPSAGLLSGGYSASQPPLNGVFILVKDTSDYLVPQSPSQMARALFEGFQQAPYSSGLPVEIIGRAFQAVCDLARRVPGYELHFRRTPDFWKLIDEQFPG